MCLWFRKCYYKIHQPPNSLNAEYHSDYSPYTQRLNMKINPYKPYEWLNISTSKIQFFFLLILQVFLSLSLLFLCHFSAFINSFTLLLPLVHFALLCLPGRVSVQAGLRRKSDKWAEERGIGSEPGPNERERRADAEREKAANGSLRVDLMRNGRGKLRGVGGEKWGQVWWRGETRKSGVIYGKESTATKGWKGESRKWESEGGWGFLEVVGEREVDKGGRGWKMDGRVRAWRAGRTDEWDEKIMAVSLRAVFKSGVYVRAAD